MSAQTKNPIFWSVLAFVAGMGFGAWGLIRNDAIGNYKGAGFLIGLGIALIVLGAAGMFALGGNKRK